MKCLSKNVKLVGLKSVRICDEIKVKLKRLGDNLTNQLTPICFVVVVVVVVVYRSDMPPMAAIFAIGSGSPTPRLSEDFSQQAQHFVSTCMTRYVKWLVKLTDWLTHSLLTHWWLTDWLAGWLAGWMAGWMADWLADWITDWLTDWLTNGLAGWMDGWQTDRRLCCSDNNTPGVRCSSYWLSCVCVQQGSRDEAFNTSASTARVHCKVAMFSPRNIWSHCCPLRLICAVGISSATKATQL